MIFIASFIFQANKSGVHNWNLVKDAMWLSDFGMSQFETSLPFKSQTHFLFVNLIITAKSTENEFFRECQFRK
jgi:hypothetical protein